MKRRTLLTLTGLYPLLASHAPASTLGVSLLNPRDPGQFAIINRKVRYRLDDGLVFHWMHGTKYAQTGTDLVPLLDMLTGTISAVKNHSRGYDVSTFEQTFYFPVGGSNLLREWKNLLTGEMINIDRAPVGPVTVTYLHDGERVLPESIGGAPFEAKTDTRLVFHNNDDIWLTNDSHVKLVRGERSDIFEIQEWSISHASLAEVSDPANSAVAAEVNLQEVTSWPAWMRMGTRTGTVTSRGVGGKVLQWSALPNRWRQLMESRYPGIAMDPAKVLLRGQTKLQQ